MVTVFFRIAANKNFLIIYGIKILFIHINSLTKHKKHPNKTE